MRGNSTTCIHCSELTFQVHLNPIPLHRAKRCASIRNTQQRVAYSEMDEDAVPEEIEEPCTQCHEALAAVDRLLKPALSETRAQLEDRLDPIEYASLMLLLTYSMNSLYWVYLVMQGIDPKSHLIKRELERVQKVMKRAQAVAEQGKPPPTRLDTSAAKRFIHGALQDDTSGSRLGLQDETSGSRLGKRGRIEDEAHTGDNIADTAPPKR